MISPISLFRELSQAVDNISGIRGSCGYLVIVLLVVAGHNYMNSHSPQVGEPPEEKEEEPPRNFTASQLSYFDGNKDEKTGEEKPVYLSVKGTVFDVSNGRNFYGPDGPYEAFAGHECGVALAKMSFDTEHLDDLEGCDKLTLTEKAELEGWYEKFKYYRCYPVKGSLVPDSELAKLKDRVLTKEDLAKHTGEGEIPKGYAASPIYVGAGDKVFDVSFGGVSFYGAGGGYNLFAGKDVSRALAKMSFKPEDVDNTDVDDLEDKQKKVLDDWINTFEGRKGYPIVGRLGKESK